MITEKNSCFVLSTNKTTYAMKVNATGQLEHIYYGRKITIDEPSAIVEKHAFAHGDCIIYDNDHPQYTLEDVALEMSSYGKGDIREPMVELIYAKNGSTSTDFVFDSFTIGKGKEPMKTLPSSYDDSGEVEHLTIVMKDQNYGFTLELHYYVFADMDVITRSAKFINTSEDSVRLERMLSLLMDFDKCGYHVSTFTGAWTKEMNRRETVVNAGKFSVSTMAGSSSNRANPFFMVADEEADENRGDVYGFNLIYSGNHYEAVEVSPYDKTRIVAGINPTGFSYTLQVGEEFEAPEVVMTFSHRGYANMSLNMHHFVREHITRGPWKYRERPILLNSWEAAYFDIDESKLVKMAKAAKDVGIELFVMDDGWFGKRNDDKSSLGDWDVNPKKLPNGLKGLCDKINALGLDFGIWIEPEMINVDSDLYRTHPNWAIEAPGHHHSEGRTQRILDLCNPEVVDYMTEKISAVLSSANIAYVKWDYNRIFSDYYSPCLSNEQQTEVGHRYILGFYRMLKTLTERFPDILWEGCASGGNRFDLGVLCYYPQIWGSDNTDAISRLNIQQGYSYGYPQCCYTAHVAGVPNHQTLRITPMETRFAVAAFGNLGYECNLCDASREDIEEIKTQVAIYKKYRKTLQFGDFYRLREGNVVQWTIADQDKSTAVSMVVQREVMPADKYMCLMAAGLDPAKRYHFTGRSLKYNIKSFGDLINTVTPVHIKQDSMLHNIIAKVVKMDGEVEDCYAYGDSLMNCGVRLAQAFVGTGYSEEVRYFPDFGARIYFIEEAPAFEAE